MIWGYTVFKRDGRILNFFAPISGVGSDLVCMGEQPLHAAPLFKVSPG